MSNGNFASADLTIGQVNAIVKKLGGHEGALKLLRGELEIVIRKHLIDLDADPFVPDGLKVKEHRKGGQFEWNAAKVALYLDESQKEGKYIVGDKLRKKLADQPVLNANVLDYLIAHPDLIPEEWKDKATFFWGTIYRNSNGNLYVRYLLWDGDKWNWSNDWLNGKWNGNFPAAVLASA